MGTRERRERRTEQLREWADGREARSKAELDQAHQMADAIPFGQPILVGHHSERRDRNYRDRIHNKMVRGVEDGRKARDMASRADNIEAATEASIFDDDPDAVPRLEAKIAALEAERDRWKAYNASCRKGQRDVSLLDDQQQAGLASVAQHASYQRREGGAAPAYVSSNLSGQLSKLRDRLKRLQSGAHLRERSVPNRYPGRCEECGADVGRQEGVARKPRGETEWIVLCEEHAETKEDA